MAVTIVQSNTARCAITVRHLKERLCSFREICFYYVRRMRAGYDLASALVAEQLKEKPEWRESTEEMAASIHSEPFLRQASSSPEGQ